MPDAGFRNRITLDGADSVRRQFEEIGQAGEKAFASIKRSAEATNFSPLQSTIARLRASFGSVGDSLAPVHTAFSALSGPIGQVRNSIATLANSAVPGLGTALAGLGIALAGKELVSFATDAARGVQALNRVALSAGLTGDSYQAFTLAAARAGVDQDVFNTSLGQFSKALGNARLDLIKTTGQVPGAVQVFRGVGPELETVGKATEHSSKALDEMRGGIQGAGAEVKVFRGSMSDLPGIVQGSTQAFHGASQGVIDFSNPFKTLGINISRFTDDASGNAQALLEVGNRLSALGDSSLKAALGERLFGRSWREALPGILAGAQGVKEADNTLRSFNLLLSQNPKEQTQANSLVGAMSKFEQISLRVRQLLGNNFGQLLTPLFDAAANSIGKSSTALNAWATIIVGKAAPAVDDLAKLIQGANSEDLKTDFGKGLLILLQSERDLIGLVVKGITGLIIPAFNLLAAAGDAALSPINDLLGTKLQTSTILGTLALAKLVGAFGAITTAIGLAKAGIQAFALIAAKTPFGFLAAGVGLLVFELTKNTPAAKQFWDSITGGSSDAATAVGEAAKSAADFGGAAKQAEKSVTDALGVTQDLGDAAKTTASGFGQLSDASKRIAGNFAEVKTASTQAATLLQNPTIDAGSIKQNATAGGDLVAKLNDTKKPLTDVLSVTEKISHAGEDAAGKMVDIGDAAKQSATGFQVLLKGVTPIISGLGSVQAKTLDVQSELQRLSKTTVTPKPSAGGPAAGATTSTSSTSPAASEGVLKGWEDSLRSFADRVEKTASGMSTPFAVAGRQIADFIRIPLDVLDGDWSRAWQDAKTLASDTVDGVKRDVISLGGTLQSVDWGGLLTAGFDAAKDTLVGGFKVISDSLKGVDWGSLLSSGLSSAGQIIQDSFSAIKPVVAAAVAAFGDDVKSDLGKVGGFFSGIFAKASADLSQENWIKLGNSITVPLGEGLDAGGAKVLEILSGLLDRLKTAATSWATEFGKLLGAGSSAADTNAALQDAGKSISEWLAARQEEIKKAFSFLGVSAEPPFLILWRKAITDWTTQSANEVGDGMARLSVPDEPSFLGKWKASLGTWLSGQTAEIKAAFGAISIPSPISSAAASTTLPAFGAAATATGDTSSISDAAGRVSSALDDAKSRLNDLITGVPAAVADALTQVTALISQALDQFNQFVEDRSAALADFAATALQTAADLINSTVDTITGGFQDAFDTLQSDLDTVFSWISGQINTISGFLSTLSDTVSSIASSIGGAVSAAADAIPGFAGGGHIRGPGTSTSDDVLIAASTGEHITRARAVTYYGPRLFDLLNRMAIPRGLLRDFLTGVQGFSLGGMVGNLAQPIVNVAIPRFAQGGLVTAPAAAVGGGKTTVPIVLDGQTFNFLTDDEIAESFVRTARKRQMTSGGRRVRIG